MKTEIENVVVDEANQRTYIVRARRPLTDGEIYRLIRRKILERGGKALASGETLTLTLSTSEGIRCSRLRQKWHPDRDRWRCALSSRSCGSLKADRAASTDYLPVRASLTEQEKFIVGSTNRATICISTICRSKQ